LDDFWSVWEILTEWNGLTSTMLVMLFGRSDTTISKNQYVSLSSSLHKPLYLIVKKVLFPFTNLIEFMATALPEQLHRRLVWISPRAGSNKFQDYSWRINSMKRIGFLTLLLCICLASAALLQAGSSVKTIKFNAPGAGKGKGQGTEPLAINKAGAVAGFYLDSAGVEHGFLRSTKGGFTKIDAPGAVITQAESINTAGDISGFYADSSGVVHGFLRTTGGAFTTIDAPHAGTAKGTGTEALNIDPSGTTIAGIYIDSGGVAHCFVRATNGTITEFSAKGAGTKSGQGTFTAGVDGINHAGAIPGTYANSAGVFHSFVRSPKGAISKFTVSGAGTGAGQGVLVSGINTGGTVTGIYIDSAGADHGHVLAKGKVTKFSVPGAGTGSGQGTEPENINTAGDTTGQYLDSGGVNHGFLRLASGSIMKFNISGAGTAKGQGTIPSSNNDTDAITGDYIDSAGVFHGFLLTQ
jgi:hypothetical protein